MTTGLASGVANSILDSLARNVTWTAPAAFCVKLHTGDPGAAGTANAAGNTTRVAVTCSAASAGGITNSADVNWTNVGTAETYSHVSFWSATSAGTFLGSDDLNVSRTVAVGDNFSIAASSLTLALTPIAAQMSGYKNFAYSTVATAPSPASSGTSLVVAAADGAKFPTAPFNVTIWPSGSQPTTTNAEIAEVTAASTDTFTITRAVEETSARTVVIGDQIMAGVTAAVLDTPQTNTVPTEDASVLPNYSAVVCEEYVLDATHELVFGDPSEMAVI